jgi:hypothetical protein
MSSTPKLRAERIAFLNDMLRTSLGTAGGGRFMLSRSVACLPEAERFAILKAAREFAAFNPDNDPHHEHDCACFEAAGHSCLFKIDYYDKSLEFGSEDPTDPKITERVLVLMLAEDY